MFVYLYDAFILFTIISRVTMYIRKGVCGAILDGFDVKNYLNRKKKVV